MLTSVLDTAWHAPCVGCHSHLLTACYWCLCHTIARSMPQLIITIWLSAMSLHDRGTHHRQHKREGDMSTCVGLQVSQAVNAWRDLSDAAATAGGTEGSIRPSQDIRAAVGMTGVTTTNAGAASRSAVTSAIAHSTAPAAAVAASAAAAADDDDDDGLELVGEQTLDEVLAVSF